jgi:hypothetical protein
VAEEDTEEEGEKNRWVLIPKADRSAGGEEVFK